MTTWSGNISKMKAFAFPDGKVNYQLPIGDELIEMNTLIGKNISVEYKGQINCIHCSRKTNKSFSQGYCFVCMRGLAQCDTCIIKPELCHYSEGTCREPEWGEANCLQDHIVYLSNTGNVKVGITRHISDNVSSRWIDQGATQALAILRVKERLLSGLVETEISKFIGDKTNWRTMLKGKAKSLDLIEIRDEVLNKVDQKISELQQQYGLQALQTIDTDVVEITYPVNKYPEKIKSINLDKDMTFSGELVGIKGQYLLLDQERVINVRKYAGYCVSLHA
ncbi:DUF2797 domain-containing protein [Glaciecola petra]|uniref:DUF2797 domain-containing protein n=1 Tax=Glaciecola petra TaxID=3075602 RepID=A0ABU2ZUE4_9ALTE|nr:DUF2797 domain-containing protein [Aestuariibacter sp. P117]MDT0596030.1 DUF2797 domain-containing protein [Aestuariibacter sp. P117]